MSKRVDFRALDQPQLSPALLEKVADTFGRKIGGVYCSDDALAWWNWVWPEFEAYWKKRRYKDLGRAIISWAGRVREYEIQDAIDAASVAENLELEREQERLNEEAGNVIKIDYFAKLGGRRGD